MPTPTIQDYLKFANLQMAAEAILKNPDTGEESYTGDSLKRGLILGNNRISVFVESQAIDFMNQWEVLDQKSNTPTGFSGTVFKALKDNAALNIHKDDLVISFRSTEFIDDAARDNEATNKLELAEGGFAFGQIEDMEKWYSTLTATGGILDGKRFSVTGYSLGGHLATVFNQLHGGAVDQVITFNGAGVGKINKGNLVDMVAAFHSLRGKAGKEGGLISLFNSESGLVAYSRVKAALDVSNGIPSAAMKDIVSNSESPIERENQHWIEDKKLLIDALDRALAIQAVARTVPALNSGNESNSPKQVLDGEILGENLDYQLAVLATRSQFDTKVPSVGGAAVSLILEGGLPKDYILPRLGNQYDVVGWEFSAEKPVAVTAHSFWHVGTDVKLFIEDQPNWRGGILKEALIASFVAGGVRLLVPEFSKRDFGDDHSLVLLVDSLNVQNALLQLIPEAKRADGTTTLQTILKEASWRKVENGAALFGDEQGKAEGDVLENMLNALADLVLGSQKKEKRLTGNPEGNTWANLTYPSNSTYTGREKFYEKLKAITDDPAYKQLAGKLTLEPSTKNVASAARRDFGAFAALYSLSPFVFSADGTVLADAVGGAWKDIYKAWEKDKAILDDPAAPQNFNISREWIDDRAAFLDRANWFNEKNIDPSKPGIAGNKYQSEKIKWEDVASEYTIIASATEAGTRLYYFGDERNDPFSGSGGNDHLYGGGGADKLNGLGGDDYLEGDYDGDILDGGIGNDTLFGGGGVDILIGGAGEDTYIINTGDGSDTVVDADRSILVRDGKRFAGYFEKQEGTKTYVLITDNSENKKSISINSPAKLNFGNGETVTFQNLTTPDLVNKNLLWVHVGDFTATPTATRTILGDLEITGSFDDLGNKITTGGADVPDLVDILNGSEGNDLIQSKGGDDVVHAKGGDDVIEAGSGRDAIDGGAGKDIIIGGTDADILYGGAGNDQIYADTRVNAAAAIAQTQVNSGGRELLVGGDGDDLIIGAGTSDVLLGGANDDLLIGGAGDDDLFGDLDGSVVEFNGRPDMAWTLTRNVSELNGITTYRFDFSRRWFTADGSPGGADSMYGGAGSDWLLGGGGDDYLDGGADNDVMYGEAGNDALIGGAGNDVLVGDTDQAGDDWLSGGAGDDTLVGGDGKDILDGGTGLDSLTGGGGNDTYNFALGDARDTIVDDDGLDSVLLPVGLADLRVAMVPDMPGFLGISYSGSDSIAIKDGLKGAIDIFELNDGKYMLASVLKKLKTSVTVTGTNPDGNTVYGGSGNDDLSAASGTNIFQAGDGNNTISGGTGKDTYVFSRASAFDTIRDAGGNQDNVQLIDIAPDEVKIYRDARNFQLVATATQDAIKLVDGYIDPVARVETVTFDDGTVWDYNYLVAHAEVVASLGGVITGTPDEDVLSGQIGADWIYGLDGNDTISGLGGNDTIDGGAGDDVITSGDGNDTILGGDGNDTIDSGAGTDTVEGGAGSDTYIVRRGTIAQATTIVEDESTGDIDTLTLPQLAPNQISATSHIAGDNIVLRFSTGPGAQGTITLPNTNDVNSPNNIEQIVFSDGSVWDHAALLAHTVTDTVVDQYFQSVAGAATTPYKTALDGYVFTDVAGDGFYGDDVLLGSDAKDTIYGAYGNDVIEGGLNNDMLHGGGGNDSVDGGSGNDLVDGGNGADNLSGGDGDDVLNGGYGDDRLTGGQGEDILYGGDGYDTYVFNSGDGFDTIIDSTDTNSYDKLTNAYLGTAEIVTGAPNKVVFGAGITLDMVTAAQPGTFATPNGVTLLQSSFNIGAGDDSVMLVTLRGTGPAVQNFQFAGGSSYTFDQLVALTTRPGVIEGGGGVDILAGSGGDDRINGRGGNDLLFGGGGNDILLGGKGDDFLEGDGGGDTLDGGAGNDRLEGGSGNDSYVFGRNYGTDTIDEDGSAAGGVNTVLMASDVLADDVMITRDASDNLLVSIKGSADQLKVQGYFSRFSTQGHAAAPNSKIDRIVFGDGEVLTSMEIDARLGGASNGDDYLSGTSGNDVLNGLGGNDTLEGNAGDDTLDGGAGDDTLRGGDGNDTYLFGRGSGQDTIVESDTTPGKLDTVRLDNVLLSDVTLKHGYPYTDDLVLTVNGSTDQLTVKNYFASSSSKIDRIVFGDGYVLDDTDIDASASTATEESDVIYGTSGNDAIDGLGGDDLIYGGDGNDTLIGGDGYDALVGEGGNDSLYGGAGLDSLEGDDGSDFLDGGDDLDVLLGGNDDDTLYGGAGNDYLYGDAGNDFLSGDAGDDTMSGGEGDDFFFGGEGNDIITGDAGNDILLGLSGDDSLDGGDGNDLLSGGFGNDLMAGGTGDDVYLFDRGWGTDTVIEYDATPGKLDAVHFEAHLAPGDITVSKGNAGDLVFSVNGAADTLTIQGYFNSDGQKVDRFEFMDGNVWDTAYIASLFSSATEFDDVLDGSLGNDLIDGRGGNDRINGLGGNDTLIGGSGNDVLVGGDGNDTLDGGAGNDTLFGENGNDTYVFGRNYGRESIRQFDSNPGRLDTLVLGAGIAPADITLTRDVEGDLFLNVSGGTDRITFFNWYSSGMAAQLDRFVFNNGVVWDATTIESHRSLSVISEDGRNWIYGTAANEVLTGLAGSNRIYGFGGNDTLQGRQFSDTLEGGSGSDTYLFGRGDGADTIVETTVPGDVNRVQMAANVAPANVLVTRDNSNLYLKIAGTNDRLTLQNWFVNDALNVQQVVFTNGTIWDVPTLLALANTPTQGDDLLIGTAGDDVIDGLGGNDYIDGRGGNNTLLGGVGFDELIAADGDNYFDGGADDDYIVGGAGNDTYVFGHGRGLDTIYDTGGNYTIQMTADVSPDQLTLTAAGDDLNIALDTGDSITIQSWFSSLDYAVPYVTFVNGPTWDSTEMQNRTIGAPFSSFFRMTGGEISLFSEDGGSDPSIHSGIGLEEIFGGTAGDTFDELASGNVLYGGLGSDTYEIGPGNGRLVTIVETPHVVDGVASDDNNRIVFGAGITPGNLTIAPGSLTNFRALDNYAVGGTYDPADLVIGHDNAGINGTGYQNGTPWGGARLPADNRFSVETGDVFSRIDYPFGTQYGADQDRVLIKDGTLNRIQSYQFADGTVWTHDQIMGYLARESYGTSASDSITGRFGTDIIFGNDGDDVVFGLESGDYLYGGAGNDALNGGAGVDYLDGGTGNDLLEGGADGDYLFGQAGNDQIYGNGGNDYVEAGAGNDFIDGGDGADHLDGGDGNDGIFGGDGNDFIQGDTYHASIAGFGTTAFGTFGGNDDLHGGAGDDVIYGLDGADTLSGDDGDDFLDGGNQNDLIYGGAGTDTLRGDLLFNVAFYGDDYLDGGTDADDMQGGAGNDTYVVDNDGDLVTEQAFYSNAGNGVLNVPGGIDLVQSSITYTLTANVENLTLTGTDAINGTGNELDNVITGNVAANVLAGLDGNDTYVVQNLGDIVVEAVNAGNDTVQSSVSYVLAGNVENLTLTGGDAIDGTGNSLSNIFRGNSGNNTFIGGDGSDVYHFARGSGQDTIVDVATVAGSVDVIEVDAGVLPSQIQPHVYRIGNDLQLAIDHAVDRITVRDWFTGSAFQIEEVRFDDGTVWDVAKLQSLAGTAPDNTAPVSGTAVDDQSATENQTFSFQIPASTFVDADAGDSLLYSVSRADGSPLPAWLSFNTNNRTFSGIPRDADVGTLSFKVTATDVGGLTVADVFDLTVADVNNAPSIASFILDRTAVEDGAFSFQIPANTFVDADAGDTQTYSATLADGAALLGWVRFDAATRTFSGTPSNSDVGTIGIKVIATDSGGLSTSDVFNLTVSNINDAPTVATPIQDQAATQGVPFAYLLSAAAFSDVDAPYGDELQSDAMLGDGSPLPGWLYFDSVTNLISGTPGSGDLGVYSIKITATDSGGLVAVDTFDLTVSAPAGLLVGGTSDDDLLDGSASDDVLTGGSGNDTLSGGEGNDTYVFGIGDGIDHIVDGSGNNTISFSDGVAEDSLSLDLGSLLIYYGPGTDAIHIDVFDPNNVFASPSIVQFRFANGDSLDFAQLLSRGFDLEGTTGDDAIIGTNVDDRILGLAGNDSIDAGAGNDVLDGGLGNDLLSGGAGNDRYVFGYGGGFDSIDETGALPADNDSIDLQATVDDVVVSRSGSDVVIALSGSSDRLTLRNFEAPGNRIESVNFAGGTVWDRAQLANAAGPVNHAPVLAIDVGDQSTLEDATFNFTLPADEFVDTDRGDLLTLSAARADGSALPTWLLFNAATRTFSSTPANADVGTVALTVVATDSAGAMAFDTFSLSVINTNDAPTLAIDVGDQSTLEDAAFSFTLPAGEFADIDAGDTVTLSASRIDGSMLPSWLGFSATTRSFTGTPVNADVGTIALKVVATDGSGAMAFDTFNLAVINTNDTPTLAIDVGDQSTLEDSAFSFTLPTDEFADVDFGDTLTLSATRTDGSALPSWLSFNAATGNLTGTPVNADVGTFALKVVATDGSGATAFDTFSLSVVNTNDTPTLVVDVGDQSTLEDAAFSFILPAGEFADVDAGDTLTLGATLGDGSALPSWLTFNAATRTFNGTPVNADVGTFSLKVVATDGAGAMAIDTFNLSVINTNDAPLATSDSFSVLENATTSNLVSALLANDTDPDAGDTRRVNAVNTSGTLGVISFNSVAQTLTYTANSTALDALRAGATAIDTFSYTVADAAGATSTATVSMTVTGVNDAPVLNLQTANQAATVGNLFALTLAANTFADLDIGDTLSYSARLAGGAALPSWLSFNAATRTLSGTATLGDVGNYIVNVVATDSYNLTALDPFTLSVTGGTTGQTLIGTAGNDVLVGGAGNDTLDGRGGSDRLVGNDGNDTFKYFSDATWTGGFVAYNAGSPGNAGTAKTVAIAGKNRSFEVFDGGNGEDVIVGTTGDDAIFLDDGFSAFPGSQMARIAGIERIEGGTGNDVIDLTSSIYAVGNITLDGGDGNDVLWASSGNDVLLGGAGNDDLFGGAGQDYLNGGVGNDTLNGDRGNDLMEGSAGNDSLSDGFGNNLFYAKDGNDSLSGGDGKELFIGGAGNDNITTGTGADIIAFNHGDGRDSIAKSAGQDNTVSLGGGIRYSELFFSKQGNNLVLQTAANEDLTFTDWYAGSGNRSVVNLQMIVEGSADYAPGGADVLRDNKVERFDFNLIAQRFDQARAATPSVANHWSVMNALLDTHLGVGSDAEALGGDLAYRYGANGTLAGIGINSAQGVLAGSQFGFASQTLQPFAGLQDGLVKLG